MVPTLNFVRSILLKMSQNWAKWDILIKMEIDKIVHHSRNFYSRAYYCTFFESLLTRELKSNLSFDVHTALFQNFITTFEIKVWSFESWQILLHKLCYLQFLAQKFLQHHFWKLRMWAFQIYFQNLSKLNGVRVIWQNVCPKNLQPRCRLKQNLQRV